MKRTRIESISLIDPVDIPLDGEEIERALAYLREWDIDALERDIEKVIEKCEATGNVSGLAWILVWRSRVLQMLEQHELEVVDETGGPREIPWRDIITDERRDFESQFFEFEVAAMLLSFDLDVAFVEASGDRPAPDLLVNGDMWVECKRKHDEPEIETWRREKQGILDDVIEEEMELDDTLHSFMVTFQESKAPQEIDDIASTLREMIENNLDSIKVEGYEIKRTEQSLELSDDGAQLKIGEEYRSPGTVDTRIINYANNEGEVEGFTGAELRFTFSEDWFYPEKIQRPLQKARSQNLSEKDKGTIFISVPQLYLPELYRRTTPEQHLGPESDSMTQLERLDEVVTKRFLNTTETVNAVCLIVMTFTKDVTYSPLVLYWKNQDCQHPDQDFVNTLDRISKSYYGYLLANS